ncbi:MAG: hypothetical protein RL199_1803 [Pseudomonadota bacterium]|jgi:hypothetical protein
MPTITPPFQRRITNPLQRPLASDLNLQAFYDSVTQSYMSVANYSATPGGDPTFDAGFIGNSFRCYASTTSRDVIVQKGVGFIVQEPQDAIGGIVGVNSGYFSPVVCEPNDLADPGLSVPVEDLAAGLQRIDLVCVKSPNYPTATENIGLLNPTSSTFAFAPRPTQFTENTFTVTPSDPDFIRVVTGTPSAGTPAVPSVPSGYIEIARIDRVPVGSGNLSNSDIEDRRFVLIPHGARSMALEFNSNIGSVDPAEVVGFDFGNNGVHAAVRAVYSGGLKYYEVYVSSGSVNPGAFHLVAGGWCSGALGTTPSNQYQGGLMSSVYSKATVTRASALPIFAAAGTYDALIGPTVAKFVVLAGPLDKTLVTNWAVINIDDATVDNQGQCTVRLSLFAQAF